MSFDFVEKYSYPIQKSFTDSDLNVRKIITRKLLLKSKIMLKRHLTMKCG